jgi:hypothetical protein
MIDEAAREIRQNNTMRDEQVQTVQTMQPALNDAATEAMSHHPSAAANAPQLQVRGVLHGVHCGAPALLELQVEDAAKTIALYSNNYFKIPFSSINEPPQGDMHPCKDLEGKYALVSYAPTEDKAAAGEIVSIALGGGQVSEHVAASATAAKREARGVLHAVRCGPPSALELEVDGPKKIALYANDYYKITFMAMNYKPDGEIHPCSDLEGKHAIVLYAVTDDKTAAGEILSVALSR